MILWGGQGTKNPPHALACPGVLNQCALYTTLNTCLNYLRGGASQAKGSKIFKTWRPCWGHVGACWHRFSLLGASWASFSSLAAFVVALGRFLCVLGRSGLDFGRVRDAPGRILKPPRPYFDRFLDAFACSCAGVAWILRPLQNTGRSGTKHTSEHAGHPARDAKNEHKSVQQPLQQRFRPRACEN